MNLPIPFVAIKRRLLLFCLVPAGLLLGLLLAAITFGDGCAVPFPQPGRGAHAQDRSPLTGH
jgi:hypothetical protein